MNDSQIKQEILDTMISHFMESVEKDLKASPSNEQHLAFAILKAMETTFYGCCDYIDHKLSATDS